jgi:hypothetical protein
MCFLYGNKDLIILLSRASYQQLVTILTKKTEAGIFKTFIAIAFKKISYPLLASYSTGYTSSVTGYTYPQFINFWYKPLLCKHFFWL